jgi:hypothetical protein
MGGGQAFGPPPHCQGHLLGLAQDRRDVGERGVALGPELVHRKKFVAGAEHVRARREALGGELEDDGRRVARGALDDHAQLAALLLADLDLEGDGGHG